MTRLRKLVPFVAAAVLALALGCGTSETSEDVSAALQSGATDQVAQSVAADPDAPATPLPAAAPDPLPQPTIVSIVESAPAVEIAPSVPETPAAPIPVVFPYAALDGNGAEVIFDRPPDRIVAYDSAVVEILFCLGEGHRVVGTHDFIFYPPEAADVPRMGGAFNMSVEQVVAAEPDLVFLFFERFAPDLERAGVKVFFQPSLNDDFIQVADKIRMWGRIVGQPGKAEEMAADFEARAERIRTTMEPYSDGLSIFQDVGGYWAPGPDTLVGEVFNLLKLRNIAHDVAGYAQLSPELIVERNPQVIITPDPDSFMTNPAFANVRAVRNRLVFTLPSDSLSIAGPRFVEGIEELADLVYSPLFAEVP